MGRARNQLRAKAALLGGVACLGLGIGSKIAGRLDDAALEQAIRLRSDFDVGSVSVDAVAGRVTLANLSLSRDDVQMRIGRVEVPLRAARTIGFVTQALAQSAPVMVDDLRIEVGRASITIPHLKAEGTMLTAEDLARIFDPKQAASLEDRLAKLSASVLSAPEVRIAAIDPDAAAKNGVFTVRNVVLSDVVAGKIKTLAADGASVVGASNPDLQATFDIGKIAATNLDVPLAVKIASGSRSDVTAPQTPVYDSFSISSIKYAETAPTQQRFEIGQLEGSGLKARPLLVPVAEFAKRLDNAKQEPSDGERRRTADLVLDAVQSLGIGHLGIHDLSFTETGQDKPVAFRLANLAVDADDVLRVGKLLVEGVSMATPDVDVTIARFAIEGLDQTGLADALKKSGSVGNVEADLMDNPSLRPKIGKVSLGSLHMEAPATGLDGNSADGSHYVFDVPVVELATGSIANTVVTSGTSRVEVIYDVASTAPNASLQALAKAGFGHLDVTSDTAVAYDPAKQTFRFDRFSLLAKDLGKLSLDGALSNVTADAFGSDNDMRLEALQKVKVDTLQIGLDNQGMIDKVLPMLAAQSAMTLPAYKKDLKLRLSQIVLETLGESPTATQIVNAGTAFIDKPKSLTLKMVAPHGLGLSEVAGAASPKDVLDMMTLTAKANQ